MLALLASLSLVLWAQADTDAQSRLAELERILPESPAWDAWQERSGELPPDFSELPSRAIPPDPLAGTFAHDGEPITTPEAWQDERAAILDELHHWILGSVPEDPPAVTPIVLEEREEAGATIQRIELRFGPEDRALLGIELFLPEGDGPFPVFLTQHNHRGWGLVALRRGYAVCVYNGSDSRDDTVSFNRAYPAADWSKLTRRAWGASRCVDYLTTLPEINADQIALTGHSRNGKQSLMAAAMDPRIAVVISSSSGAGGALTTREYSEQHFGEGIEIITRRFDDWFHPRFRFFVGREHKLPVDLHHLVALSAPRPCLLSIALNDGVESTWAMERTYRHVQPVWRLHDAPEHLRVLYRPGGHETTPTVIERYLDWCDRHFGRGDVNFPERLIWPHDFKAWQSHNPDAPKPDDFPARPFDSQPATQAEWKERRAELPGAIGELLGPEPPRAASPEGSYGEEKFHKEALLRRTKAGEGLEKHDLMFGDYLNADVYAPEGTFRSNQRIPAVLWLHPMSTATGYIAAYNRGDQAVRTIARAGYAVFAYDQIGHGGRVTEIEGFYDRYPQWSVLGQMVRDAQAAIDVIEQLPYVDRAQIHVVGYSLGALAGMHLAALDDRPAGFVFYAPPLPFRLDTERRQTGGVKRWSHDRMLVPRLGAFLDDLDHVPYDLNELAAAAAPRPVLYATPTLDRHAPLPKADTAARAVEHVYNLHNAPTRFTHIASPTYNHFDPSAQQIVINWLNRQTE